MNIAWNCSPEGVRPAVDFFLANKTDSYISHGEMMWGRATLDGKWSDDLEELLLDEFQDYTSPPSEDVEQDEERMAGLILAREGDEIVGLAVILIEDAPGLKYATIEDLVVRADLRGRGIGSALIEWISAELKARGVGALFLESGLSNHNAHEFFKSKGFRQVSITMERPL